MGSKCTDPILGEFEVSSGDKVVGDGLSGRSS